MPPCAPRDFAGVKAALVSDFAAAFAASVGGSEEVKRAAFLVAEYLKGGLPGVSPNVSDLGGLFKVQRWVFARIVQAAGADAAWVETWEDILDFTFPCPTFTAIAITTKRPWGGNQSPRFKAARTMKTGATMKADGSLELFVLTYSDFPLVECANPALETISKDDLEYVLDRTKIKYQHISNGNPSIDKTMRKHLGSQLRVLFPHLPDRGLTIGARRDFTEMLKWRFQNPRRASSIEQVACVPSPPPRAICPHSASSFAAATGSIHIARCHGARRLLPRDPHGVRGDQVPHGLDDVPADARPAHAAAVR
jgi:hypothetical protein